ncbi:T9SS type A sorting domain-containing protein [Rhodocaloribacter litoris]|uniref:T9SS type A sorting domain-containing protein n=1 Tax=Rhodocaloribacter litoris TaxID=2558931 RepID=UPI001421FD92|nr:T9SS type A sorting domain-containing protein [Rhodocaloribacter litoris]QXD14411.1 T9SS type A sorting domain-containing protein [Rhodocaloribacter litoris]
MGEEMISLRWPPRLRQLDKVELRQEVVADTLIDEDLFYKLKVISFDAENTTIITETDTSYYYRAVINGVLSSWTPEAGKTESEIQFFRDFNTCYTHANRPDGIIVQGAYDTTFTFPSGESSTLAAVKEFVFILPQARETQEYGYGIGLLHSGGEPSVSTTLTYARIGGQEYGTPLDSLFDIRVSLESPSLPKETFSLSAYPNPSYALTHFALVLAQSGRASIRVYNVLGQLVAMPLQDVYLPIGNHTIEWNAEAVTTGVYFAELFVEGHPVAKSSVVVTR